MKDFQRIAIVNRGEAAMRLIHAVREFNAEHGTSMRTIAIYTDPDRDAMFVREADETVSIGAASFVDESGRRKNAYVNYDALRKALVDSRAEAVWVGWGFVSEHAEFADLCEQELGLVFIGPDGDCMRRLGDKITSKVMAEEAGVPVAPWSRGPVPDVAAAVEQAEQIGFPLMVKATAGGGGRGIRAVRRAEDLEDAFTSASSEAATGFGNATVFMEALVEGARHIEVQVIADTHGNVWSVGIRDCSVQRRNQKLIEESSSPVLTTEQEDEIKAAAARLCAAAGYRNAGTVEFLYDPRTQEFAFMEVNARLQVEHPVTEVSADLDLVKMQIHVARGGRLDGDPPPISAIAIEIRLNAEDPDRDFAPAPGRIELLRLPTGAGIRVDTGVEVGDRIPAEFDSMIAKIIAFGKTRQEALARLQRALRELAVVIEGGTTNRAFLLELLQMPSVVAGRVDVGWLDREPPSQWVRSAPGGEIALAVAAVHEYERVEKTARQLFLASARRGRPQLNDSDGVSVELRHGGHGYKLNVCQIGVDRYRIELDGETLTLRIRLLNHYERRVTCAAGLYRTVSTCTSIDHLVEVDGHPHRVSRDDGGTVRSPAPAVVVSVNVSPGDEIEEGTTLAVLEAMKLEMRVTSPFAGTVRSVEVAAGEQVDASAALLRLMPSVDLDALAPKTERLAFDHLECVGDTGGVTDAEERLESLFEDLTHLVLGFDVPPAEADRSLTEYAALALLPEIDGEQLATLEEAFLERFCDVAALAQRRPAAGPGRKGRPAVTPPSYQESLHMLLRAPEGEGEGLPGAFRRDLASALTHYRVSSLEPTRRLEEALLHIVRSHRRIELQLNVVQAILKRRLRLRRSGTDTAFRALLERLIQLLEIAYPAIADLALECRYSRYDKGVLAAARETAYAQAAEDLDVIDGRPDEAERARRIASLVACPQPLMTLLSKRFVGEDDTDREAILETLVRRYYRVRDLHAVSIEHSDGHPFVRAEYDHEGSRITLIATHMSYTDLTRVGNLALPIIEAEPNGNDIVLDFYVYRTGEDSSEEDTVTHVRHGIDAIPFPRPIRRIAVSVRIPGSGLGMAGQRFFTFRPSEEGYWEEGMLRGLHPMMAKRLHLWRFKKFDLERIDTPEDIYLFRARAKDDPSDERLFAVAEVRDMTPYEDENGKVTALPYLEHMFQEALAGIRLVQMTRSRRERLHWNRLALFVWQPMDLSTFQFRTIVHKLFPATQGLGLQKVIVRGHMARSPGEPPRDTIMEISNPSGRGPSVEFLEPDDDHVVEPMEPLTRKMLKLRQRGVLHPYEVLRLMTPRRGERSPFPHGNFVEYDLADDGRLHAVHRAIGANKSNIITGVITNFTDAHPEGLTRVAILSDPGRGMCPLAEPECSRIIAALDLAEQRELPVEWFAISAGAKIAMDSGTENLDWTAAVLRRIIEFTQAGGEVNVVVSGINVGAQSYWNAEATMLMHTRGILIMTPQGAMVLTGKQALDYSGGVSAEDNLGIGGYDRVMGPNGLAQYWASDISDACRILLRHYEHSYRVPGERFPRRIETTDPIGRDISDHAYDGEVGDFGTVGEIFSDATNPGRKKPFEIRSVMQAVVDADQDPLERWSSMRGAEVGVVWDARLGGRPVCLIGIESYPQPRTGQAPADGPAQWTAGTLFPRSSRKIARAINAASDNRPVVVLANLSGFDGSPESMRKWQLEYGAEIGRAVTNFSGPMVFCVISRYHGGAFVVFSKSLNEHLEVAALEGSFASVIGGAPAAGVVFVREVRKMVAGDPRIKDLVAEMEQASGAERASLRADYEVLRKAVQTEKRSELAREFEEIHTIDRAMKVGSVDHVLPASRLRPYLIEAVERGIGRWEAEQDTETADS